MNETMMMAAVVLGVIVISVVLLQTKYKKIAAEALLYLVMQAEQQLGGGTGQLKYATVTMWLYELLPPFGKLLLPAKIIDRMIEEAVLHMKAYLEEQERTAGSLDSGEHVPAAPEEKGADAVTESEA